MFKIEFSSYAAKFVKKLDKQTALRIMQKIELLGENPFPSDVKRVVNRADKIFRIRIGDYRVQYSVSYSEQVVFISDISRRPKAY